MALNFLNSGYFAGSVGIGTDSPSAKLEVAASATTSVDIAHFSNSNGSAKIKHTLDGVGSGRVSIFDASNNEDVRLSAQSNSWLNAGNVGIGTASPAAKLTIKGSNSLNAFKITDSGDGDGFKVTSHTTQGTYVQIYNAAHTQTIMLDARSDSTARHTYFNGGGNVGIGATNPGFKLEVDTNGVHDGIKIRGANAPGLTLQDDSSASLSTILIQSTAAAQGNLRIAADTNNVATGATIEFQVSGSERMRISNAGAVRFNDYGAGTLVTDASGNITVSSGGGAGGPYLPLSAGASYPLTSDLYIPGFIYHVGDTNTYFGFGAPDVFDLAVGGSRKLYADSAALYLYYSGSQKLRTTNTGVTVIGDIQIDSALLSNQENTDVDTGTETVASVAIATYTAAFFDFVIKKTTNVRSGTVYACHDGTNVEFTETSTQDLGDTSDVTLSVDISGGNMRLLATVTSDDWSVKSLIRAI